jgi:formylglycine-generating enzyme required for sulfatase activity
MGRLGVVAPLVLVSAVIAAPLALAQGDGGAPAPMQPDKPLKPAPQAEGEGDEPPDHPTPPDKPKEKPPPFVKQPTVLKDGMVRIPGGRFTMGSSEKTSPPNERPSRVAMTTPFWLDKTEVTVAMYRACVDRGACQRTARTSAGCTYDSGEPSYPINCVSWNQATAYCAAVGKRLPREVEWEAAARGPSPIRYPWGGAATSCGMAATLASDRTQRSCSGNHPAKVGAHGGGASPFGVVDMSGNVEEWVSDWYSESVSEASPRAGSSHVLRGGGWLSYPSMARTTSRNWGSALEAGPNVGFRCARDD